MESLSYNECHYQSYLSAVLNCFYWKIPWTEELGTLQSMGLHRVRYNRTHAQYTRITLVILRASWEEESCQRKETNGKILCSSVIAVQQLSLDRLFCNPRDWSLPGSSVHGDSPGKNTGVGCHFLLQGSFPIQGLALVSLAGGFFTTAPPGEPFVHLHSQKNQVL